MPYILFYIDQTALTHNSFTEKWSIDLSALPISLSAWLISRSKRQGSPPSDRNFGTIPLSQSISLSAWLVSSLKRQGYPPFDRNFGTIPLSHFDLCVFWLLCACMYLNQSFVGYNRAKEMISSSRYWESRDSGIWVIDGMCKNSGFEVIYFSEE